MNEYKNETLEPIVNTPSKNLDVEYSDVDIFKTSKGIEENAEPIVNVPAGEGQIVNTILVKEVKYLITKAISEALGKVGIKLVTVETLPEKGEPGTIYLLPNASGSGQNLYDEYIWNLDTLAWEKIGPDVDLSNYVNLTGAQTISGEKTFNNPIYVENIYRRPDASAIEIAVGSSYRGLVIGSGDVITYKRFYPGDNVDLGRYIAKWKDFYLAGLINPNSSGYGLSLPDTSGFGASKELGLAEGTFNVIKASDIANGNKFNSTQLTLLRNGKPTKIVGDFLDLANPIIDSFMANNEATPSWYRATIIGANRSKSNISIGLCFIATLFVGSDGTANLTNEPSVCFENISPRNINGKSIPAYPTTNTSPQVLTIAPNGGSLSWDDPFTPTSVSLSDGGTISDTTLQENIQYHRPIVLNGFTCYFSCDDGTNYQYVSTRYDSGSNKNHINVITINKSTWVATFHTSDLAVS